MADGGSSDGMSMVPDDVRAVGVFVRDLANDLLDALRSVASEVDAVAYDQWLGDAGAAFHQGWGEVRDGGVEILRALGEMAEKLGVSADTVASADADTVEAIASAGRYELSIPPDTFPGQRA